jgi:fructosamine-3-kinase
MTEALGPAVAAALGVEVTGVTPVTGGCISEAGRVALADGRVVFAKSAAGLPPDLLAVEADGLAWLREAGAVHVPAVLALTEAALVLEWIDVGARSPDSDELLGRGLAGLHAAGADAFGWHRDGYIGSLPQSNAPASDPGDAGDAGDWPTFWFTHRIEPLSRQARRRGRVDGGFTALVKRLGARIADLSGPAEPPARLHGDLWAGNVLVDRSGEPWLVDPAAYGGHREVDLAMLHLFGQPSPACASAYHEAFPLADGWRDRLTLWQLEPLLTHTVMFGGSYGASARAVLDRFA